MVFELVYKNRYGSTLLLSHLGQLVSTDQFSLTQWMVGWYDEFEKKNICIKTRGGTFKLQLLFAYMFYKLCFVSSLNRLHLEYNEAETLMFVS